MIFGRNRLVITYENHHASDQQAFRLEFDPQSALSAVSKELPAVQVPAAAEWLRGR